MRAKRIGAGALVIVALALLAGALTQRGRGTAAAQPDYRRTPVLFVHGHGMSSATWTTMRAEFVRHGYPPEYLDAVDIVPNTMPNARAAVRVIAPAAESLLARAARAARRAGASTPAPTRLDLVSHSMGAISTRWYAARLRPERVRVWISLAGAHHGTAALCPHDDPAAQEMCPAFASRGIQAALNGTPDQPIDETPYGLGSDRAAIQRTPPDSARAIAYFSIRIEPDGWIEPSRSAVLDGAGAPGVTQPGDLPVTETSPGNYLFRLPVGHDPLPHHPELIRLVWNLLGGTP